MVTCGAEFTPCLPAQPAAPPEDPISPDSLGTAGGKCHYSPALGEQHVNVLRH